MTVAELIEALQHMPSHQQVRTSDHEVVIGVEAGPTYATQASGPFVVIISKDET